MIQLLSKYFIRRQIRPAIVIIGVALLPFAVDSFAGRTWVRILDFTLLYIMLALGLNITVGFAGLLDLGYVAFYALGAYCYALLASPQFDLHLPFWILLPLSAGSASIFGILLGTPTLRLRGDYLAIVTLGFGEITRIFLNNLNAPLNITNGPQGINKIDPLYIAGHSLAQPLEIFGITFSGIYLHYYLFLVCVLGIIFIVTRLQDSRIGRAWAAIREDEVAAVAMGIDTRDLKRLAFAIGAAIGGFGGGLFAAFQGFVSPESFSLLESVMILCMVVLGGMGHIPGVILGAVLLTVLPELLRYIGPLQDAVLGRIWVDPADLRLLLFGLGLVGVMLFRPEGLWPSTQRARELAPADPDIVHQEQESLYDVSR